MNGLGSTVTKGMTRIPGVVKMLSVGTLSLVLAACGGKNSQNTGGEDIDVSGAGPEVPTETASPGLLINRETDTCSSITIKSLSETIAALEDNYGIFSDGEDGKCILSTEQLEKLKTLPEGAYITILGAGSQNSLIINVKDFLDTKVIPFNELVTVLSLVYKEGLSAEQVQTTAGGGVAVDFNGTDGDSNTDILDGATLEQLLEIAGLEGFSDLSAGEKLQKLLLSIAEISDLNATPPDEKNSGKFEFSISLPDGMHQLSEETLNSLKVSIGEKEVNITTKQGADGRVVYVMQYTEADIVLGNPDSISFTLQIGDYTISDSISVDATPTLVESKAHLCIQGEECTIPATFNADMAEREIVGEVFNSDGKVSYGNVEGLIIEMISVEDGASFEHSITLPGNANLSPRTYTLKLTEGGKEIGTITFIIEALRLTPPELTVSSKVSSDTDYPLALTLSSENIICTPKSGVLAGIIPQFSVQVPEGEGKNTCTPDGKAVTINLSTQQLQEILETQNGLIQVEFMDSDGTMQTATVDITPGVTISTEHRHNITVDEDNSTNNRVQLPGNVIDGLEGEILGGHVQYPPNATFEFQDSQIAVDLGEESLSTYIDTTFVMYILVQKADGSLVLKPNEIKLNAQAVEPEPEVNNNPNAVTDTATTGANLPVTIDVLKNDSDADGDILDIVSFTQGADGVVTKVNGKLIYTPQTGFSGTDSFTYTVNDRKGGKNTATVTVTINGLDITGLDSIVEPLPNRSIYTQESLNAFDTGVSSLLLEIEAFKTEDETAGSTQAEVNAKIAMYKAIFEGLRDRLELKDDHPEVDIASFIDESGNVSNPKCSDDSNVKKCMVSVKGPDGQLIQMDTYENGWGGEEFKIENLPVGLITVHTLPLGENLTDGNTQSGDPKITYFYNGPKELTGSTTETGTTEISLPEGFLSFSLKAGTTLSDGTFNTSTGMYTADKDSLSKGETVIETFTIVGELLDGTKIEFTVSITITGKNNIHTIESPDSGKEYTSPYGESFALPSVNVDDVDIDDNHTITWEVGGENYAVGASITWEELKVLLGANSHLGGNVALTLNAEDQNGNIISQPHSLVVSSENNTAPENLSINQVGDSVMGGTLEFTCDATDAEDNISGYEWFIGETSVGTGATFDMSVVDLYGDFGNKLTGAVKCVVTDEHGETSDFTQSVELQEADKDALRALQLQVMNVFLVGNEENYTAGSLAKLDTALEGINSILNSPTSTQEATVGYTAELQDAFNELVDISELQILVELSYNPDLYTQESIDSSGIVDAFANAGMVLANVDATKIQVAGAISLIGAAKALLIPKVNTAPEAVDDSMSVTIGGSAMNLDLTLNDTDVDSDPLNIVANSVSLVGGSYTGLTHSVSGNILEVKVGSGYTGPNSVSFMYQITDDTDTANGTVIVTINQALNTPLEITKETTAVSTHNSITVTPGECSDSDGNCVVGEIQLLDSLGVIIPASSGYTYSNLSPNTVYTVKTIYHGKKPDTSVEYKETTQQVTTAANLAPVITGGIGGGAYTVGQTVTLGFDSIVDPEGESMTYQWFKDGIVITDATSATFSIAMAEGGGGSFSLRGTDESGNETESEVLEVTYENSAPTASDINKTTDNGTPITLSFLGQDNDGDSLTYTVSPNNASLGSVVNNEDGTFMYTPVLLATGTDSFTYTATDGNGGTSTATVNIIIEAAPDTTNPTLNYSGNTTLTVQEGGIFTAPTVGCSDDSGSCTVSMTGSVDTSILGENTLTYIATDEAGNQSALLTITVHVVCPTGTTANPFTLECDADA